MSWTPERIVGTAAGGVLAVAAFLPWVTANVGVFSTSASGTAGDGTITLILGLLAAVGFTIGQRWATIGALACGAVALLICGYNTMDILGSDQDVISVGYGLVVLLLAAGGVTLTASVITARG